MNNDTTGRGAVGGTSSLGAQVQGNITFGVTLDQLKTQLNPGAELIVIQRMRQSEPPQVWSTGDPEQTQGLFRQAYTDLAFDTRSGQSTTQRQPVNA